VNIGGRSRSCNRQSAAPAKARKDFAIPLENRHRSFEWCQRIQAPLHARGAPAVKGSPEYESDGFSVPGGFFAYHILRTGAVDEDLGEHSSDPLRPREARPTPRSPTRRPRRPGRAQGSGLTSLSLDGLEEWLGDRWRAGMHRPSTLRSTVAHQVWNSLDRTSCCTGRPGRPAEDGRAARRQPRRDLSSQSRLDRELDRLECNVL
jgi:hypothetical protein